MKKVKKIEEIRNLAVFKDFKWDNSVKNKDGIVEDFKDINILYGRNYSGKTTLSRIFRAFETGILSDKYENPEFKILFDDDTSISQKKLNDKQNFRVFNSDFIDENLSFLRNPDDGEIQPFAIMGEENNILIPEIEKIQNELGKNTENEKTGLYKELEEKNQGYTQVYTRERTKVSELERRLTEKARSMKNTNRTFVEATYNINSIKADIKTVSSKSFSVLAEQKITELNKVLQEELKTNIQKASCYEFKYNSLIEETQKLLSKTVESAGKIQELVEDTLLNGWVEKGLPLHLQRKTCAFCGQTIPEGRINELQHHFNEEMDIFQKQIENEIYRIESEKENIFNKYVNLKETDLYVKYQDRAKECIDIIKKSVKSYITELDKLIVQLKSKKENVFSEVEFVEPNDVTQSLTDEVKKYNKLIEEAIEYGKALQTEKNSAKESLRFNTVAQFLLDIKYQDLCTEIANLRSDVDIKKSDYDNCQSIVTEKEKELESKKTQLNDEKKGANKVNEYLSNFFGHDFLQLIPVEEDSGVEEIKHYRFEVQRNGKQAFNLSEGECRLVAFSYFMAKLNDTETANQKPIIWIDDPICSLDSNHVFFVYSLIYAEIVKKDIFNQLFVSTHNLDFLKYLKELSRTSNKDKDKAYFLIERYGDQSQIIIMPEYIQKYVTEFNYLFNEIYKCSKIDNPTDENYNSVYNFGNNARKFLEIYLFYMLPDSRGKPEKFKQFFGAEEKIPKFINDRITNEFSHLEQGGVERATNMIDVPEFKKDAQLILDCIKNHDEEQYNALLNSVGIQETD